MPTFSWCKRDTPDRVPPGLLVPNESMTLAAQHEQATGTGRGGVMHVALLANVQIFMIASARELARIPATHLD